MTTTDPVTIQAIERVYPTLRNQWENWNIGSERFFSQPHKHGNVRIAPYKMTANDAEYDEFRSVFNLDQGGRWVPQGDYVRLEMFQKSHRLSDADEPCWEVVMSDTPDEMNDHLDVLLHAKGRVLVHGLGLGCVLNCLLHNPEVTHVDVVEVNQDLLRLLETHYYQVAQEQGKTLEFHNESCVTKKWPAGTRWNYVWHDIWTSISASNLTDKDDPEHGISYEMLHRKFGGRCDQQGSWGFDGARTMRDVNKFIEQQAARWAFTWNNRTPEERTIMMAELTTKSFSFKGMTPEQWIEFLSLPDNPHGNKMLELIKTRVEYPMELIEAKVLTSELFRRIAQARRGMVGGLA